MLPAASLRTIALRARSSPRLLGSAAGVLLVAGNAAVLAQATLAPIRHARPAVEGNRAPYDLVFSPDGKAAYATESAEGTVAVVDTVKRTVVAHYATGGDEPTGLALSGDGRVLYVTNSHSGSVACLDVTDGRLISNTPLRGAPYGVVVAPGGRRAYVTVSQLDQVVVLDLSGAGTGETGGPARALPITTRIPVGRRPRAAVLTPDGKHLVVGNLSGASVSIVDTDQLKEVARVPLRGTNVRGVALAPEGKSVYAGVMPAFNGRPTRDPAEVWHNLIQEVTLSGGESGPGENQWLDFVRLSGTTDMVGTPDLHDLTINSAGRWLWATIAGRDALTRITIHDPRRDAIWPISQVEAPVGANPRGLALTPDEREIWTADTLGNSLTVVNASTMQPLATIPLGKASRRDPHIAGQYLFHNAGLTASRRFTCNSCHPDGASDGLTWSFVHVHDGVSQRNSRDLRGGVGDTAPFRWSGVDRHFADFVNAEVTGLLGGPQPTPQQTAALAAAVNALRLPANPYRRPDGSLTPTAREGANLFYARAGCGQCHAGPLAGGTGRRGWVGTTPEGTQLDVPHLRGACDSAPYLHDGRARTLEEIFSRHNQGRRHGNAHLLGTQELAAVLRYVREL